MMLGDREHSSPPLGFASFTAEEKGIWGDAFYLTMFSLHKIIQKL
jgi:hypothetical protein